MLEIETLHSFDTEYSADSVEWCHQSDHQQIFAVGTYQLEEKEASSSTTVRKGRIYLFSFDDQSNELIKFQQLETDAVLDQTWKEIDHVYLSTLIRSFNQKNILGSAPHHRHISGKNRRLSVERKFQARKGSRGRFEPRRPR